MSKLLHLILYDLRSTRWALALYVLWLGVDILCWHAFWFRTEDTWTQPDGLGGISNVVGWLAILIVLPEIAFAHPLRKDTANWRTRPFSQMTLFCSKLILFCLLIFVIPLLVRTITHWFGGIVPSVSIPHTLETLWPNIGLALLVLVLASFTDRWMKLIGGVALVLASWILLVGLIAALQHYLPPDRMPDFGEFKFPPADTPSKLLAVRLFGILAVALCYFIVWKRVRRRYVVACLIGGFTASFFVPAFVNGDWFPAKRLGSEMEDTVVKFEYAGNVRDRFGTGGLHAGELSKFAPIETRDSKSDSFLTATDLKVRTEFADGKEILTESRRGRHICLVNTRFTRSESKSLTMGIAPLKRADNSESWNEDFASSLPTNGWASGGVFQKPHKTTGDFLVHRFGRKKVCDIPVVKEARTPTPSGDAVFLVDRLIWNEIPTSLRASLSVRILRASMTRNEVLWEGSVGKLFRMWRVFLVLPDGQSAMGVWSISEQYAFELDELSLKQYGITKENLSQCRFVVFRPIYQESFPGRVESESE